MILVIQTNVSGQLSFWLIRQQEILRKKHLPIVWHGSDRALVVLDELLRQARITVHQLKRICVVRGPGSFTSVRIGLILANTIGALTGIPLYGVVKKTTLTEAEVIQLSEKTGKRGVMVRPWYGKAPNITRPTQARARR